MSCVRAFVYVFALFRIEATFVENRKVPDAARATEPLSATQQTSGISVSLEANGNDPVRGDFFFRATVNCV